MADEWIQTGTADFSADWTERFENWSSTLEQVAATAAIVETALLKAADLLDTILDFATDLLNSIIGSLYEIVKDLLNSNAFLCVHHNLKQNARFRPGKWNIDPSVDKLHIPVTGTGLDGWIYDIVKSANQPRSVNAMAPPGDADTPVGMAILLWGFPLDVFIQSLDIINSIAQMFKLGTKLWPEGAYEEVKELFSKEALTDDDKSSLRMMIWSAADKSQPYSSKLKQATDFGLIEENGVFDKTSVIANFPGAPPRWVSAAVSDFLGKPSRDFFQSIQRWLESLIKKSVHPIIVLLRNLAKFIDMLEMISLRISELLLIIDDLIIALKQAHIILLQAYPEGAASSGGTSSLSNAERTGTGVGGTLMRARAATGAPNFGSDGFVIGAVLGYTDPNVQSNIAKLLALFLPPDTVFELLKNALAAEAEEWKELGAGIVTTWNPVDMSTASNSTPTQS